MTCPLRGPLALGISQYIQDQIDLSITTLEDPTILEKLQSISPRGAASIKLDGKTMQPDVAFGQPGILSSLVGEVSHSQTYKDVKVNADEYIKLSDGKIQAVLILDLRYSTSTKAWVMSLDPGT